MKEKVFYDAPIIEIITIQVEKGFAASSSADPSLSVSPEWDTIILR